MKITSRALRIIASISKSRPVSDCLLRSECDGGQDYDFALRLTELTDEIAHIPDVLYHWRVWPRSAAAGPEAKPYAYAARKRAIADTLKRRAI